MTFSGACALSWSFGSLTTSRATDWADSVTVALNVKDERVGRLVGQDIAVELMSGRGIYRFGGTLRAERGGSMTVALSGDLERIQRREFVRVPAYLDVSVEGVIANLQANAEAAGTIVRAIATAGSPARDCGCASALDHAVMTAPAAMSPEARERVGLLLGDRLTEGRG